MKITLLASIVALLGLLPPLSAAEYRTLVNAEGKKIHTELVSKQNGQITFKMRNGRKNFTVDIASLSKADQEFLEDWSAEVLKDVNRGEADEDLTSNDLKSLYPKSKSEIKDEIKVLLKGKGDERRASDEQKAINLLNVYRYLCGVPATVKMDNKLNENCKEAAMICKEKGTLSHDFGHYTNKCNLSSMGDVVASVPQYIRDPGANNRERRGHRRWCLNPPMGKTGFGSGGSAYSGMWAMDNSGSSRVKSWSYPGRGYFPKDYLHGSAWSYYQQDSVPAKNEIVISITKLKKAPEKKFSSRSIPEGREIGIKYISAYGNTINFEPEDFSAGDRGIYWVSITGGGMRVGYVVEFF